MKPARTLALDLVRLVSLVLATAAIAAMPMRSPAAGAAAPAATVERHGALDVFAMPGFALGWAVLRGKDEASTEVVVRIVADPRRYRFVRVTGVDPFTHASQPLAMAALAGGTATIRLPRGKLADSPRTEWRLYASNAPAPGEAPALLVDYQGVPDTTPELADEAALAASLAGRMAAAEKQARNAGS